MTRRIFAFIFMGGMSVLIFLLIGSIIVGSIGAARYPYDEDDYRIGGCLSAGGRPAFYYRADYRGVRVKTYFDCIYD